MLDHEIVLSITTNGRITLACPGGEGFALADLAPVLEIDGARLEPVAVRVDGDMVAYDFDRAVLSLLFSREGTGLCLRATLRNAGGEMTLNRVSLLATATATFGQRPERVRVLTQSAYSGDVAPLCGEREAMAAASEPGSEEAPSRHAFSSQHIWLAYDRDSGRALLAGFLTGERWLGMIGVEAAADGTVIRWDIGFDGGDLRVSAGEELALEEVLFLTGADPHALLEAYGDAVASHHTIEFPPLPPVSWCSWYPYRLGVTEERLLETARIGAARLGAYGFRIVEADLGWERGYLPNEFAENDQFPHGLRWLADELEKLGLTLGAWKAPYSISEFSALPNEHPEWLVPGEDGAPFVLWDWYWEPHGKVYILDLTHPGAQDWLRARMRSLRERGVGYFKADFIGCAAHEAAKRRHDPRIVSGGGVEAARIGARIIREELPDALLLNCGGPELPGTGQWPLLYQCNDTGNTGFITWQFMRDNYRALATHLWKNGRWGWIQPSCLCVGLPGTLEEARLRATAAFLSGGQLDISDTLPTLPEDRWEVLLRTLPPLGESARAVDLFAPVYDPGTADYTAVCKGEEDAPAGREHPPGSVWCLPLRRDWDEWTLVAAFSFDSAPTAEHAPVARYAIPLERLGLLPEEKYWAYEFWSGQFLGAIPAKRRNPGGYAHPGDYQDLTVGDTPGALDIAFAGPGVKLLCLRDVRPHPWIVGSSFHQSCGAELSDVRWNEATGTLSGVLHRQAGETGYLVIAGAGLPVLGAEVDGRPVPLRPAANGSWKLPVITMGERTAWSVRFKT
jgi:hypothetical protein